MKYTLTLSLALLALLSACKKSSSDPSPSGPQTFATGVPDVVSVYAGNTEIGHATCSYDASNRLTGLAIDALSPNDRSTLSGSYDASGNLAQVIASNTRHTRSAFTNTFADGRLVRTIIEESGNDENDTTDFIYSQDKLMFALKPTSFTFYDIEGHPHAQTRLVDSTLYTYDGSGRLTASQIRSHYPNSYNPSNPPSVYGSQQYYYYDSQGRLIRLKTLSSYGDSSELHFFYPTELVGTHVDRFLKSSIMAYYGITTQIPHTLSSKMGVGALFYKRVPVGTAYVNTFTVTSTLVDGKSAYKVNDTTASPDKYVLIKLR